MFVLFFLICISHPFWKCIQKCMPQEHFWPESGTKQYIRDVVGKVSILKVINTRTIVEIPVYICFSGFLQTQDIGIIRNMRIF